MSDFGTNPEFPAAEPAPQPPPAPPVAAPHAVTQIAVPPEPAADPWVAVRQDIERRVKNIPDQVRQKINSVTWRLPVLERAFGAGGNHWPVVDMTEDEKAFHIAAELPGLSREDVEVSVLGEMLILKAEKKATPALGAKTHIAERSYGSFHRAFAVPGGVDATRIDASFTNGVLEITLPKQERTVPISRALAVHDGGRGGGAPSAPEAV